MSAAAFELAFSDGVVVQAELLDGGPEDDELAIDVPAYWTAAGTTITARVRSVRADRHGEEPQLVIHRRIA